MDLTMVQNRMGHIHVWYGRKEIHQVSKYNWHDNTGKESDLYFQRQDMIEYVYDSLRPDDLEDLAGGWVVFIDYILWERG